MADEMQKEAMEKMSSKSAGSNMPNSKDVEENKLLAAIGYLGVLCFIPLLAKKESSYAQFHGKQALAIFIVEVAAALIGIIPFVGWIISFVLFIVCAVAAIMGIVNAVGGKQKEIPGFTMLAEKLNI